MARSWVRVDEARLREVARVWELCKDEPAPARALAQSLGCSSSNALALLRRCEAAGLLSGDWRQRKRNVASAASLSPSNADHSASVPTTHQDW